MLNCSFNLHEIPLVNQSWPSYPTPTYFLGAAGYIVKNKIVQFRSKNNNIYSIYCLFSTFLKSKLTVSHYAWHRLFLVHLATWHIQTCPTISHSITEAIWLLPVNLKRHISLPETLGASETEQPPYVSAYAL